MRAALTALVLLIAPAIGAAQSPVKTIEDGALDTIQLFVAKLERTDAAVVMLPFDASGANLGTGAKDGKESRQQEARTMQHEGPRVLGERFVAALERLGPFTSIRVLMAGDPKPENALIVAGRFLTLDPGSRTKRYFAGFGAGKSSVHVAGSIKDSTGRTLAAFEQRRIGTMGVGGGDSLGKLMSDSRSIGEDIAKFLAKWARGEKLD